MKKFLIVAFGVLSVIFTGCLKDTPPTNFSNLPPIIEAEYPAGANFSGLGSGLQFFGGGALTYPASDVTDTAIVLINLASTNTMGSAVSGTVGFEQALLTSYNNDSLGLTYTALPDSDFTILNTAFNIPAGTRIDTVRVVFYPSKIDPTQNFMLPLGILSVSSYTISGNFGAVYFHTIGNPLAGLYNDSLASRYNYVGASNYTYPGPYPAPASVLDLTPYFPKLASPNSPTEILVPYANNLGNYIIDFDASYNLTVTTDVVGITNFIVYYANYNPATKTLHIITHYTNGAGNDRIVDETMVHQ